MLSLDKTKSVDELQEWLKDQQAVLSWKLDGLTIVLTYREGTLLKAVDVYKRQAGNSGCPTFYCGNWLIRSFISVSYTHLRLFPDELPM